MRERGLGHRALHFFSTQAPPHGWVCLVPCLDSCAWSCNRGQQGELHGCPHPGDRGRPLPGAVAGKQQSTGCPASKGKKKNKALYLNNNSP